MRVVGHRISLKEGLILTSHEGFFFFFFFFWLQGNPHEGFEVKMGINSRRIWSKPWAAGGCIGR